MQAFPPNKKLQTCLKGIYLGDLDISSQLQWMYSKMWHCQVLTFKSTSPGPDLNPVILHGCFQIVHDPFYLFPNGSFNLIVMREQFGYSSDESSFTKYNASAHLGCVNYHDLFGYEDYPYYIKNLHALQDLLKVSHSSQYSILHGGVFEKEVKVIHQMFEVWSYLYFFRT